MMWQTRREDLPEGGYKVMPLGDAIGGTPPEEMEWLTSATLCVVVVGASGDLAKVRRRGQFAGARCAGSLLR